MVIITRIHTLKNKDWTGWGQLEVPPELIDAARQFLSHGIINLNDLPQED